MRRSLTTAAAGRRPRAAALAALALAASACSDAAPEPPAERIRAIKSFTVTDTAGGDVRQLTGSVAATTTSNLSFAKSGSVQRVLVAQGDRVAAGDILAELDPQPFDLEVDAARAEVASAEADFRDKEAALDRQRQLYERKWVAKAALDQATAAFETALGVMEVARSRLASAERDRTQAVLTAPFDGLIAERAVEPFQEVTAGATLFVINGSDTLDVAFAAPDGVVARITPGMTVDVDVAARPDCGCKARIVEIGAAATTANAVPVTATIFEGGGGLLPGMTAEVRLLLAGGRADRGMLIPITAVAEGDENGRGYVFIFDPEAGVVRRTAVVGGRSVTGNLVEIVEGVSAGDVIAQAGVSFLRDGQRVTLLTP